MPRHFDIPSTYRSDLVTGIKRRRNAEDTRKVDFSPSVVERGSLRFKIARFFGFCFGVENAIEIAHKAVAENPGKRVYLLSEMIHNPQVNDDLRSKGVEFLQTSEGKPLIPFDELNGEDVVITPAFGATVQTLRALEERGIRTEQYDATCPFVEKVWKRGEQLAERGFTIVIHGKASHEETRATFSRISRLGPSIIVRDIEETERLTQYIRRELPFHDLLEEFKGCYSLDFDPLKDLSRIGVINQTTMLAEETTAISTKIRAALANYFGAAQISEHFADTRDTLCYATSENQAAMRALVEDGGDVALVIGGYNSSNTSHLVEICEGRIPVYYIQGPEEIESLDRIISWDMHAKRQVTTRNWFPQKAGTVTVLVSAGASSPDAVVDGVMEKLAGLVTSDTLQLTGTSAPSGIPFRE